MGRANNGRTGITYIPEDMQAMWDGGETQRFHTCTLLRPDTVGQHSYGVACVVMHLYPAAQVHLLRAALKHDMAEAFTGDLPAPAKRDLGIRQQFSDYEDSYLESVGIAAEKLSPWEAWLIKMADSIDGLRVCVRERTMGNQMIEHAYANFSRYCDDLCASGVELHVDSGALERARQLVWALKKEWEHVS